MKRQSSYAKDEGKLYLGNLALNFGTKKPIKSWYYNRDLIVFLLIKLSYELLDGHI